MGKEDNGGGFARLFIAHLSLWRAQCGPFPIWESRGAVMAHDI